MSRGLGAFLALVLALMLCALHPGVASLAAFVVVAAVVPWELGGERDRS